MDADNDPGIDEVEIDEDLPLDAAEAKLVPVKPLSPEEADAHLATLKDAAREATLERRARQMVTAELAVAMKEELASLTAPQERGAILDAAVVKLGLDILAGKLEPRNLAEAAKAIEALDGVSRLLKGGMESKVMTSTDRRATWTRITEHLELNNEPPVETRDAIDALASEDQ